MSDGNPETKRKSIMCDTESGTVGRNMVSFECSAVNTVGLDRATDRLDVPKTKILNEALHVHLARSGFLTREEEERGPHNERQAARYRTKTENGVHERKTT